MRTDPIADTERWFLRRGVPHLIANYNAAEDVFTRVLPLLSVIFLFSMVGALNDDFSLAENTGVAVGGFALLVGLWAGVNWLRGVRPLLSRPKRVGRLELAVFILGPALVPIVFGGQFSTAGLTVLSNIVILGVVYLGASYGVLAILSWAIRRLFSDIGGAARIGMRALPLLLLLTPSCSSMPRCGR